MVCGPDCRKTHHVMAGDRDDGLVMRPAIEPRASRWRLPDPDTADEHGLCGVGADLEPGTLLAAYRSGLFPMPVRKRVVGWWSPDPRGILPLDGLTISRSLRRSCRRYEVRFDTRFREVMERCGDPNRPHGWITPAFVEAYERLFEMGWVHSVETYLDGELVGGLYGLRIGGLFAGESMFSAATDASKVALIALVQWLNETGGRLLDVQWQTEHLASLGVIEVSRARYRTLLAEALAP
ncbi:MAG: leucyl/phenylalanyl-tRNA--protein transferase [Ilumatobacteraceae bacterium]|nr:leucyl/phenylalanyl-tRNA--protein transferase [Ilumatobacteraceae bacterium]